MPQQLLLHPSVDKFGVGPLTQNATTCQMIVITGTECYPKGPKHPKKKTWKWLNGTLFTLSMNGEWQVGDLIQGLKTSLEI